MIAAETDGEEVVWTSETQQPEPKAKAASRPKAKAKSRSKGNEGIAELILEQIENGYDVGTGGSLAKLSEYLDKQLSELDEGLASLEVGNRVVYQGVATPVELRKRLYLCSCFMESRVHFKIDPTILPDTPHWLIKLLALEVVFISDS